MKSMTFMQIAYMIAQESKCVSWSVGALIEKNGRIISTGYNGSPSGGTNCCDHARDQGWMLKSPYKNPKYIYQTVSGWHESDIQREGLQNLLVPEGAHICVRKDVYNSLKNQYEPEYTFFRQKGSESEIFTKSGAYAPIDVKEPNWYPYGSFWSNLVNREEIIWKSKNQTNTFHEIKVLNPVHRAAHSEWSATNEIHAELNAIVHAAKNGLAIDGATMYVTLSPCADCAKSIAQSGIKRLVYCETYDRIKPGWDKILREAGIDVININKSNLDKLNWSNIKTFGGLDE